MRYLKDKPILIILGIYVTVTVYFLIKDILFYTNYLNPLFWSCIIVYVMKDRKEHYTRVSRNTKYYCYILMISAAYMVINFYLGFIFGFAKSPYNHEIFAIIENGVTQLIPIIGIELTRGMIVTKNKRSSLGRIIITILLILLEINYYTLISTFVNKEAFFKYVCSTILPLIAYSSVYTYLSLKVSCMLPLMFRISWKWITLLVPILPDLNWFITGTYQILFAVVIYVLFQYQFLKQKKEIKKKKKIFFEKIQYMVTLLLATGLVCFMLGLFPYEPIALLSSSMSPTIDRGDVVIFKKLNDSALNNIPKNTILIYHMGNQNIAHRIIYVKEENGNVFYQTKGDNNNVPDRNFVQKDQILGIYTFHIKYIGFPSIWLYEFFHNENAMVETK